MKSESIFALDIQDDLVTGVVLKSGSQATVITGCGASVVDSRPLEDVIAEVIEQTGFTDEGCRVSFGAHHFYFRNLSLPFSDIKKIDKILPFELEESAPLRIENLIIDGVAAKKEESGSEIIAAMIDRDLLADRLAMLQSLGVDPEIIGVSGVQTAARAVKLAEENEAFILLDIGPERGTMIVSQGGHFSLIRSLAFDAKGLSDFSYGDPIGSPSPGQPKSMARSFGEFSSFVKASCFLVQNGAAKIPVFLSGPVGQTDEALKYLGEYLEGEVKRCDVLSLPHLDFAPEIEEKWLPGIMDSALALAMRPDKSTRGFNFRKGEFAKKGSLKEYRYLISKAAVPAMVVVLFAVGLLWYDAAAKKRERAELTKKIHGIFTQTLPDVTRIVDPIQQLEVRISEAKKRTDGEKGGAGDYRVLDVLAEISGRIPPSYQVKVTRMVVEKNNLRLKGTTDNFNTVDNVKKVLEKSPFFKLVTISSANLAPKGGEIRFELKLQLNGV